MSLERAYINCKKCWQTGGNESQNEAIKALEDERASLERVNGGDIGTLGGTIEERYLAVKNGLEACLQCDYDARLKGKTIFSVVEPFINLKKPETKKEEVVSDFPEEPKLELDAFLANNGERKTADAWIEYWNQINDGRHFPSMPDYYRAFKQLKERAEKGTAEEQNQIEQFLKTLRTDFDWPNEDVLLSSTRIIYQPPSLNGEIIHHYGDKDQNLIKKVALEIPEFNFTPLATVADSLSGLRFLQALFDTSDSAEKIIQVCEFVSGYRREKMNCVTALLLEDENIACRVKKPSRGTILSYNDGLFYISGAFVFHHCSLSRGVRYSVPKTQ